MKSYMVFVVVILACVSGCAAHANPYDANTGGLRDGQVADTHPCTKQNGCDNFDTAADYGAIGARAVYNGGVWVWDESAKAYHWATSPEVEAKVSSVLDSVKNAAGSAYDAAGNAYDSATEAVRKYKAEHPDKPSSVPDSIK